MSLTKTLGSINRSKTDLREGFEDDIDCPPYIVNRIFSGFIDTVHIAEVMSMLPNMPEKDLYTAYLGLVPKRNRFKKMNLKKFKTDSEVLEYCRAYDISVEKYNDVKHMLEEG